jgi:hypothetical protein
VVEQVAGRGDADGDHGAACGQFRPVEQIAPQGQEPLGDRDRGAVEFTEALQRGRGNGIERSGDEFVLAVREVVIDRATRRAGEFEHFGKGGPLQAFLGQQPCGTADHPWSDVLHAIPLRTMHPLCGSS